MARGRGGADCHGRVSRSAGEGDLKLCHHLPDLHAVRSVRLTVVIRPLWQHVPSLSFRGTRPRGRALCAVAVRSKGPSMSTCPNCGAQVGDTWKFCGTCGATAPAEMAPAAVAAPYDATQVAAAPPAPPAYDNPAPAYDNTAAAAPPPPPAYDNTVAMTPPPPPPTTTAPPRPRPPRPPMTTRWR